MGRKYKGWTMKDRLAEYARLKQEWVQANAYNEKAYDAFICRITKDLGI